MTDKYLERELFDLDKDCDLQTLDCLLEEIVMPKTMDSQMKQRIRKKVNINTNRKRKLPYIATACILILLILFPNRATVIAKIQSLFSFIPGVGIYEKQVSSWQIEPSKEAMHLNNGWDVSIKQGFYLNGMLYLDLIYKYETPKDTSTMTQKEFEKIPGIEKDGEHALSYSLNTKSMEITDQLQSDGMRISAHGMETEMYDVECKKNYLTTSVKVTLEYFTKQDEEILSTKRAEGIYIQTENQSKLLEFQTKTTPKFENLSDIGYYQTSSGYSVIAVPKQTKKKTSIDVYVANSDDDPVMLPSVLYGFSAKDFQEPEDPHAILSNGSKKYKNTNYVRADIHATYEFDLPENIDLSRFQLKIPYLLVKNEDDIQEFKIPTNIGAKKVKLDQELTFKKGNAKMKNIQRTRVENLGGQKTEALVIEMELQGNMKELSLYNLSLFSPANSYAPIIPSFKGNDSACEIVIPINEEIEKNEELTLQASPIYKLHGDFTLKF